MATLFVIATPIGNLEDLTLRSRQCLREADCVVAENTRTAQKLLQKLGIKKNLVSYDRNEARRRNPHLLEKLAAGKNLALVTEAGTPAVSDPGFELVRAVIDSGLLEKGVQIVPLPGPSAVLAALSVAGMDASRFSFYGFLPKTPQALRNNLETMLARSEIAVFFESPNRIEKTLQTLVQAAAAVGKIDREIVLGREITKKFETFYRGTVRNIQQKVNAGSRKGEWVAVLGAEKPARQIAAGGAQTAARDWRKLQKVLQRQGVSRKQQLKIISEFYALPRNALYKQILIN